MVYTEVIKLEDQVSGSAKQASGALESAGKSMTGLSKTMFDASAAMTIGKESIGAAMTGIKSSFTSLASGDVKGAVQGLTDSVAGMAKMLDLVVPGLGQAVAAVVQIAGGLVGITAGLIKSGMEFAIESNQAKQAMLSMFDAMSGGAGAGAELDEMLSGLSDKIGITKDALIPLTKGFLQMGVTGTEQLEKLTLAAISATAIVGKGGAEAFTNIQKKIALAAEAGGKFQLGTKQLLQLRDAGVGVSDIAGKMGMKTEALAAALKDGTVDAKKFGDAMTEAVIAKGAGPLERLGSSFEEIKKKFMASIGDMFEDIDVGPFMAEVKSLFAIFSAAPASGQAMKAGIGGFFKEVFAIATKVVPLVKHFLLDMVIYGLKAYIALKPIVKAIREFVTSAVGAAIIGAVLSSIWNVLKVIGVAILVVVAAAGVLWAAMIAVSVAVWTVVGALGTALSGAVAALAGWVAGAATAAYDFVAGLVNGIANGASQVIGAVTGLAGKATGAFKSALGIASPSKVMLGMGDNMAAGVSEGLEGGAKDVAAASSSVANASVKSMSDGTSGFGAGAPGGAPSAVAPGGAAPEGGGGKSITFAEGSIVINGAGKSALEITEEMIANVLQRMATEGGI